MTLTTLAIALVTPFLSPAQLPAGPLLGPNGWPLEVADVELSGTDHWLLGVEHIPGGDLPAVARIDGNGTLNWLPPVPAALLPSGSLLQAFAVGENRILIRGSGNAYRTLIVTPQGWQEEIALTPTSPGGTISGIAGDISGSAILFNHFQYPRPVVFDPALGAGYEEIPTTPGWGVTQAAIDGDTVIALEFLWPLQRLSVFRRIAGAWTRVGEVESPNGIGWRRSNIKLAFDRGTVAVTTASVSPQDPCPKLYLFEQDPSGDFALTAEFEAASPCATSETIGIGYSTIQLVGSELAAVEGLDSRVDRFERTAQGWVRQERVASSLPISQAWPASGRFVSSGPGPGSTTEILELMNSPGTTQITCATPAPVFSVLSRENRTQTTVEPVTMYWQVDAAPAGTPYFLAVGFQPGSRILGAMAELCISGSVSVVPMTNFGQSFGKDRPSVSIDPIAAGLPPGGTLYLQAWRPYSTVPGGLTSNGLSILFAP